MLRAQGVRTTSNISWISEIDYRTNVNKETPQFAG